MRAARVQRRNALIQGQGEGLNGLIEDAKVRSELAGIEFILSTPEALIEEYDLEEKAILEELRDEE